MKQFALFSFALVLLLAQGCTSNDRNQAGTEGSIITPATASVAPASGSAAPISGTSDPAANGGSTLPAAAPYSESGSGAAQQNVNPAPFLVASQGGGAGGATSAPASRLTTRADGTMSGPNDQPAATTGWGTPGPTVPSSASAKSTATPGGAPRK
ncbi:MAG TPA: hypothetical protein VI488_16905 [Candidatus Angelobacter sp.]